MHWQSQDHTCQFHKRSSSSSNILSDIGVPSDVFGVPSEVLGSLVRSLRPYSEVFGVPSELFGVPSEVYGDVATLCLIDS